MGMNRDSVGWRTDRVKAPGNRRKRVRISAVIMMKKAMSRRKIMVRSVSRPRKR